MKYIANYNSYLYGTRCCPICVWANIRILGAEQPYFLTHPDTKGQKIVPGLASGLATRDNNFAPSMLQHLNPSSTSALRLTIWVYYCATHIHVQWCIVRKQSVILPGIPRPVLGMWHENLLLLLVREHRNLGQHSSKNNHCASQPSWIELYINFNEQINLFIPFLLIYLRWLVRPRVRLPIMLVSS